MTDPRTSEHEQNLIGTIVEGTVVAVFRWGIIVDLRLSRIGLIDALYIDDQDNYRIDDRVGCYLDCFDERKDKYILRPPGQTPLVERLARR